LNFDLAKAIAEIGRLWDRGSFLLWVFLAAAAFLGFVALAVVALTGSPPFVQANNIASPWLLLASIVFAALAAFKYYQEHTARTVRLVDTQSDGSVHTQISIRLEVFNISDKSIWLPDLKLLRPKSHAPVLSKVVALKDPLTKLYGD
jgi:hypothetical protein